MLKLNTGGHTALIRYVVFTQDERHLVSAGDDKTIRVWDISTGQTIRVIRGYSGLGPSGKIHAAALSPNEKLLAVGGWMGPDRGYRLQDLGRIRLHRFPDGDVIGLSDGHRDVVLSLGFSPDSSRLASAGMDGRILVHRISGTNETPGLLTNPTVLTGPLAHVYALGYSPDGRYLAAGDDLGNLYIWETKDMRRLHRFQAHDGRLRALVWLPDGDRIITGASDRRIKIWDAKTGGLIRTLAVPDKIPRSLSLSPDGNTLLVSTASFMGPWRSSFLSVSTGREMATFNGYRHSILANAFSPDGGLAAIGGGRNHRIHIVESGTGRLIRTLSGIGSAITGVGISKDGKRFAWTASVDARRLDHGFAFGKKEEKAVELLDDKSAVRFGRAIHRIGSLRLETDPGGDYGYPDSVLKVIKDGQTQAEIKRDAFSGYRHRCYTFTPDGRTIISGGDLGTITAYNASNGEVAARLEGHEGAVLDLAVSESGNRLVSGSDDQTIRVWDLSRLGKEKKLYPAFTFFSDPNGEWVGWTDRGNEQGSATILGTAAGKKYIGVQMNHGFDQNADFIHPDALNH